MLKKNKANKFTLIKIQANNSKEITFHQLEKIIRSNKT